MATFKITVKRDRKFWYIEIPELDGATQARNLAEVDEMARDYIHEATDLPLDQIDLDVERELPDAVRGYLCHEKAFRDASDLLLHASWAESRKAALALKESGISLRESAMLLGVSYQRVHQMLNLPEAPEEWEDLSGVFEAAVEATRARRSSAA